MQIEGKGEDSAGQVCMERRKMKARKVKISFFIFQLHVNLVMDYICWCCCFYHSPYDYFFWYFFSGVKVIIRKGRSLTLGAFEPLSSCTIFIRFYYCVTWHLHCLYITYLYIALNFYLMLYWLRVFHLDCCWLIL